MPPKPGIHTPDLTRFWQFRADPVVSTSPAKLVFAPVGCNYSRFLRRIGTSESGSTISRYPVERRRPSDLSEKWCKICPAWTTEATTDKMSTTVIKLQQLNKVVESRSGVFYGAALIVSLGRGRDTKFGSVGKNPVASRFICYKQLSWLVNVPSLEYVCRALQMTHNGQLCTTCPNQNSAHPAITFTVPNKTKLAPQHQML